MNVNDSVMRTCSEKHGREDLHYMVINTLLVAIWTSKALMVRSQKEMRKLELGGKEILTV